MWASERYVSEASFVVRTASKSGGAGLGGFLQMTGIVRSQDDAFTVHEYMTSRDAVNELGRQLPLRDIFGRPEADFLARFPSILYGSTDEELYLYYQKMVEVVYNSTTGISALRVQAFRPEDAEHLSRALLALSEELVNRLNARIVNDAITQADAEVSQAEARLVGAQLGITNFRNQELMIDPGKSSILVVELIGKLSAELAQTRASLQEVQAASPNSPQIQPLQRRIAALEAQVTQERARVTSSSDGLADKIAQYERLNLEREFASRSLAAAVTRAESARNDARRQLLYLERIVEPRIADYSMEPRRLRNILITGAVALIFFFVGWLLIAGIREHAAAVE
jgi:capsular polysaccharide transport system permease protein